MTKQPNYLRYLEAAKQAEIAEQLRQDGFEVETDKQQGDLSFDLWARKGSKTIVYEFKSEGNRRLDRETLNRLQQAAKTSGYEFRIVVVFPPSKVNVEIDSLESQLTHYMIDHFPSALDGLSRHTIINGVSDVAVSDIRIGKSGIALEGTASVEVTLQYGGSSEGMTSTDSFPLRFSAILNPDSSLASVDELEIDTSGFYED